MWFAGNGNAAGSLFENLSNQRPSFCYYVNAPECQLIVKPLTEQKADNFVSNNKAQILNGREFSDQFLAVTRICIIFRFRNTKPTTTRKQFKNFQQLASHHLTQPTTAISKAISKTTDYLHHNEEIISNKLITGLTKRDGPDEITRRVLSPSEKVGWQ